MSKTYLNVRADEITADPSYQRELDRRKAARMARAVDMNRIGVPVLSQRRSGERVVIDGQHRITAMHMADLGHAMLLCEVHSGLSLDQEAALFLDLNSGRTAVGALDQYRAQLIAEVPFALEIESIVTAAGLQISKSKTPNSIQAVQAVRRAHYGGNLAVTLRVLSSWSDGKAGAYERELISGVSEFLRTYRDADTERLVAKLLPNSPARVTARMRQMADKAQGVAWTEAAIVTLCEIYNKGSRAKLPPLHRVRAEQEALAQAAE